jgi:hypothetical protein
MSAETKTEQVAADLRAAADVLERGGWAQGDYVTDDGCRCAIGALVVVCGGSAGESTVPFDDLPRLRTLMGAVERQTGIPRWDIDAWNDEPGRTAAEVIATLRAAAEATS